jgi:hypothetical protein
VLNEAARTALLRFVQSAHQVVSPSRFSPNRSRRGFALYDTERDASITGVSEFPAAVAALQAEPDIAAAYGTCNSSRLAIQFVYNTCGLLDDGLDIQAAFDETWTALATETARPEWRFVGVANLNNFSFDGDIADLGHGVSIQGRHFARLRQVLELDESDLTFLTEDWSEGGAASSYVIVVETRQPKAQANFLTSSDGSAYPLAARAMLAMRLLAAGAPHFGRILLKRPAAFNVGIGGRATLGLTLWSPGAEYHLTNAMVPNICQQVETLIAVEQDLTTSARHIGLALRSFSSIYDRLMHQGEDCIIDSITALEALWKLDSELSFRLAFRTASLLGETDDLRDEIFETLRKYYVVRSKIVHGTTLKDHEAALVRNDEALRVIVRKSLRAFLYLLANPAEWTVGRFAKDPDRVLLHSDKRLALQKAMAVLPFDGA